MSGTPELNRGTGNVYKGLGMDEANARQVKAELAAEIIRILRNRPHRGGDEESLWTFACDPRQQPPAQRPRPLVDPPPRVSSFFTNGEPGQRY